MDKADKPTGAQKVNDEALKFVINLSAMTESSVWRRCKDAWMYIISPQWCRHEGGLFYFQFFTADLNCGGTNFLSDETNILFWWNWHDIPPSGHLEDIQEELCRQNELFSARTHRELETTSWLSAHYGRPSASLSLGSPTLQKQRKQTCEALR